MSKYYECQPRKVIIISDFILLKYTNIVEALKNANLKETTDDLQAIPYGPRTTHWHYSLCMLYAI